RKTEHGKWRKPGCRLRKGSCRRSSACRASSPDRPGHNSTTTIARTGGALFVAMNISARDGAVDQLGQIVPKVVVKGLCRKANAPSVFGHKCPYNFCGSDGPGSLPRAGSP